MNRALRQLLPSEYCLDCYGCCRFKERKSVWKPSEIELIPFGDYFICPNLDQEKNQCKIYSQRPFDCQLYPFVLNKKKDKVFLSVHLNCPFIRENLKKKSFKGYIKYLKKFLGQKEVLDFLKKEQRLISEYPESEILELYDTMSTK